MMSAEVKARTRTPITSRCFVWNSKEPALNKGLVPSNIDVLGTFYPFLRYCHYRITFAEKKVVLYWHHRIDQSGVCDFTVAFLDYQIDRILQLALQEGNLYVP